MQADYQLEKGLENLKNAYAIYLLGSVLLVIPFLGGIGEIVYLAALIFFILGWRALGRSKAINESANYRSTEKWLLYSIIIAIVLLFVGVVLTAAGLISSILSSPLIHSPNPGTLNILQGNALQTFLGGIFGTVGVVVLIWLAAWTKMSFSLVKLSDELCRPGLARAGTLYVVQLVVLLVSTVGLSVAFSSGILTMPRTNVATSIGDIFGYYSLLRPGVFIFGILGIAASIIAMFGSYLGYHTTKATLAQIGRFESPTTPQQLQQQQLSTPFAAQGAAVETSFGSTNYCSKCGNAVKNIGSSFCTSCGANLNM